MGRGVGAGAQAVALAGSPRSCGSSRTCRSCRPRGSCRSAAEASPARSSSAASGRARSACRTAPASAGAARPEPRSRASRDRSAGRSSATLAALAPAAHQRQQFAAGALGVELANQPAQLDPLLDAEIADPSPRFAHEARSGARGPSARARSSACPRPRRPAAAPATAGPSRDRAWTCSRSRW